MLGGVRRDREPRGRSGLSHRRQVRHRSEEPGGRGLLRHGLHGLVRRLRPVGHAPSRRSRRAGFAARNGLHGAARSGARVFAGCWTAALRHLRVAGTVRPDPGHAKRSRPGNGAVQRPRSNTLGALSRAGVVPELQGSACVRRCASFGRGYGRPRATAGRRRRRSTRRGQRGWPPARVAGSFGEDPTATSRRRGAGPSREGGPVDRVTGHRLSTLLDGAGVSPWVNPGADPMIHDAYSWTRAASRPATCSSPSAGLGRTASASFPTRSAAAPRRGLRRSPGRSGSTPAVGWVQVAEPRRAAGRVPGVLRPARRSADPGRHHRHQRQDHGDLSGRVDRRAAGRRPGGSARSGYAFAGSSAAAAGTHARGPRPLPAAGRDARRTIDGWPWRSRLTPSRCSASTARASPPRRFSTSVATISISTRTSRATSRPRPDCSSPWDRSASARSRRGHPYGSGSGTQGPR